MVLRCPTERKRRARRSEIVSDDSQSSARRSNGMTVEGRQSLPNDIRTDGRRLSPKGQTPLQPRLSGGGNVIPCGRIVNRSRKLISPEVVSRVVV